MKFRVIDNNNGNNYPIGAIIDLPNDKVEMWRLRGVASELRLDFKDPRNSDLYPHYSYPNWRGNNIRFASVELIPETSPEKVSLVKKKIRKTHIPDKYKENMVINLNKDRSTLYLSATLRDTLLHQSNRIGFAFDADKNTHYVYCEMEDKEGYEVNEAGNIESVAEWRDLNNHFNKTEVYVSPVVVQDVDNPDYLFYEIMADKAVKAPKATKKSSTSLIEEMRTFSSSYDGFLGKNPVSGLMDNVEETKPIKEAYRGYGNTELNNTPKSKQPHTSTIDPYIMRLADLHLESKSDTTIPNPSESVEKVMSDKDVEQQKLYNVGYTNAATLQQQYGDNITKVILHDDGISTPEYIRVGSENGSSGTWLSTKEEILKRQVSEMAEKIYNSRNDDYFILPSFELKLKDESSDTPKSETNKQQ